MSPGEKRPSAISNVLLFYEEAKKAYAIIANRRNGSLCQCDAAEGCGDGLMAQADNTRMTEETEDESYLEQIDKR